MTEGLFQWVEEAEEPMVVAGEVIQVKAGEVIQVEEVAAAVVVEAAICQTPAEEERMEAAAVVNRGNSHLLVTAQED